MRQIEQKNKVLAVCQRGFTLVELMIVIVIFGILTSVLVPGVATLLSQQDVKGSSERVRALFLFARSQAAVENVALQVVMTPAQGPSGGVLRVYQGSSTSCVFEDNSPLVRELELVSGAGGHVTSLDSSQSGRFELPTSSRITEISPQIIQEEGICFRPDGSVRDAETNLPIAAPPGTNYGAGDVVLVLQDHIVVGENSNIPQGTPLRVLIPYNGIARVTF